MHVQTLQAVRAVRPTECIVFNKQARQ